MTRECKSDFLALKDYVESYAISDNLKVSAYIESLKSMHKCYFGLIICNSELEHNKADFLLNNTHCNVEIILRLSEVVSDMRSALFNWMNGSYKTSRIMMRTGLENFIRGFSALEDKSQLLESNVYKLFEKSNDLNIFKSQNAIAEAYSQLHSDYKILCLDTHTTYTANMEQISSLAGLPLFEKRKAEDARDLFIRVVKNINTIFCLEFNSFFHSFHHRNKENILNGFNNEIKPLIMHPILLISIPTNP